MRELLTIAYVEACVNLKMRRWAISALLALAFATPRLLAADPDAAARLEQAKALFHQGVTLFGAGDTERALELFLRSRALVPSGKNTANAAICLERLGRLDEALELYEEVLTRFAADLDAEDRETLAPAMLALRQKLGYLELSSNVDGLVVVDGRDRGRLPLATALRLLPGTRIVRVLKDGYRTFEQTITVEAGRSAKLDAALEPLAGSGAVRVESREDVPVAVFIDGNRIGTTPVDATFPKGRHVLRTEGAEEGSAPAFIDVLEGKTLLIRVSTKRLGAGLWLTGYPKTAELFLDDVPLGRGEWHGRVPLGLYGVSAKERGYFTAKSEARVDQSSTPLAVRLDLRPNPEDPRWPAPRHWRYDLGVTLAPWLAPRLGSGAESSCPSLCSGSKLAWGGFAELVAGAQHESGIGAELLLGYGAFEQRFWRAHELPTLETAVYFSLVTYTTIGFGDVVLGPGWRVLAGIEGLTGIILIGWSTAFVFAVVNRMYEHWRLVHHVA